MRQSIAGIESDWGRVAAGALHEFNQAKNLRSSPRFAPTPQWFCGWMSLRRAFKSGGAVLSANAALVPPEFFAWRSSNRTERSCVPSRSPRSSASPKKTDATQGSSRYADFSKQTTTSSARRANRSDAKIVAGNRSPSMTRGKSIVPHKTGQLQCVAMFRAIA